MLGFSFVARTDPIGRAKYRQSENSQAARQLALDGSFVKLEPACGFPLEEAYEALGERAA